MVKSSQNELLQGDYPRQQQLNTSSVLFCSDFPLTSCEE